MKQYTIKDIANMAQVSRGTVDRVLHKRGKISKEAQEKVIKVLKEIQYRPNIIARSLKTNRSLRVVTLIPNYSDDAYWFQCVTGCCIAAPSNPSSCSRCRAVRSGPASDAMAAPPAGQHSRRS